MRKLFITLLISLIFGIVSAQESPAGEGLNENNSAQDITGQWHGLLEIPGNPLRLKLEIDASDSGYTATLYSPDQHDSGIPVNTTTLEGDTLSIAVIALNLTYTGGLANNRIKGTFNQSGFTLPLEFSRQAIEKPKANRPQEPKEPFPYHSEEVVFRNSRFKKTITEASKTNNTNTEAPKINKTNTEVPKTYEETSNSGSPNGPSETQTNITLAGTLTMPEKEGKYPVAILISGSGPQDRNESLAGHKPFLVISDYLTRNGIAVLRFDDRGVGESTGNFDEATSADFATDVQSAIDFLKTHKNIDHDNIGLIGHSEGGMIAPMVAAENADIGFIVLMAGVGIPGDELLSLQGQLIQTAAGNSENDVEQSAKIRSRMIQMTMASKDMSTLRQDLTDYLRKEAENESSRALVPEGIEVNQFIKSQVDFMATPWMVYFLRFDPAEYLEKVSCPVLAINGTKDLQVPDQENLSAIGRALEKAANKNVTLKPLEGLNHLFQESETGLPTEYSVIEQTFALEALEVISNWISEQVY